MTEREALKLALEALVNTDSEPSSRSWKREIEAITAIKEALAQPEQEPYAIEAGYGNGDDTYSVHIKRLPQGLNGRHKDWSKLEKLLYTTPPQRKPLTDDEILSISADCASSHQHMDIHFARAIEAALKAKNSL